MSAKDYLNEHGQGRYEHWHVPDLVRADSNVELVFVFESPHVDELEVKLPVVGSAGKSALRFLVPGQPKGQSLGCFVKQRHDAGDGRIAIVNVSNVPMQRAAFVGDDIPDLDDAEWTFIEKARTSTARLVSSMRVPEAREISEALAVGLHKRLSAVGSGADCRVVAAGNFARRMVAKALPDLTPGPLLVPHPSRNAWSRKTNQELTDLVDVRDRFEVTSSASWKPETRRIP